MTRVLHLLDHSLPLHSGYAFRTRALMQAQQAHGMAVAGLTGLRQVTGGGGTADQLIDGLSFHRTPGEPAGPTPYREWREVDALAAAAVDLHARWPFDLIHAHSPALVGLAGLRAARRLKLPLLYEIRAFWEDAAVANGDAREGDWRYRLTRALENHVVRGADAVSVICEGLRRDLVARGVPADKIMIAPNGVDLTLFGDPPPRDAALAAELGLDDAPVIGFVGSFYAYEGLDQLIAALPSVAEQGRPAQLLLVGGGPMEGALKSAAAASLAAQRIHFTGRVPHQAVERYYGLIDILAYPRKRMRLTELVTPLKPLEAMAEGRIVAASDVGGHRELIEDRVTGTLFPADDPRRLAAALNGLLADRHRWPQRRQAARAYVARERDWLLIAERYEPVYHRLIAPGQARVWSDAA